MSEAVRILICDDEPGVRESLKLILERTYPLAFVSNGEEALRYLKRRPVDLLVLDVKMPKMGGLDILRQVKRGNPKLKVLMVTGYESADVVGQAARFGADGYITKPFNREEVASNVEKLIGPPLKGDPEST